MLPNQICWSVERFERGFCKIESFAKFGRGDLQLKFQKGDGIRRCDAVASVAPHVRGKVSKSGTGIHQRSQYINVIWLGQHPDNKQSSDGNR